MIEIIKGDDVNYSLSIDGANISDYTFNLQIRPTNNNDSIIFESTEGDIDMTKSNDGIVIFKIPKEKTINFHFSNASLGVFYIDNENRKKTVITNEEVKIITPVAR